MLTPAVAFCAACNSSPCLALHRYCKVHLLHLDQGDRKDNQYHNSFKSKTRKKTLEPVFKKSDELEITEADAKNKGVLVEVWSRGSKLLNLMKPWLGSAKTFLGRAVFPIADALKKSGNTVTVQLAAVEDLPPPPEKYDDGFYDSADGKKADGRHQDDKVPSWVNGDKAGSDGIIKRTWNHLLDDECPPWTGKVRISTSVDDPVRPNQPCPP